MKKLTLSIAALGAALVGPNVAASDDAAPSADGDPASRLADDLVSALLNLGFPRPQSEKEVASLLADAPEMTFEDALKNVLRKLSG